MWLAYVYTNDFKLQTSPPRRESKRLWIMPFQTLSMKQSEVAEFGITRLQQFTKKKIIGLIATSYSIFWDSEFVFFLLNVSQNHQIKEPKT